MTTGTTDIRLKLATEECPVLVELLPRAARLLDGKAKALEGKRSRTFARERALRQAPALRSIHKEVEHYMAQSPTSMIEVGLDWTEVRTLRDTLSIEIRTLEDKLEQAYVEDRVGEDRLDTLEDILAKVVPLHREARDW